MGSGDASREVQQGVDLYFDSVSGYWDDVYTDDGLQGEIYRRRQARVLARLRGAGLRPGARVLEVGSGGGRLTVELARRGLTVHATDSSPAMVRRTLDRAAGEDPEGRVSCTVADVHALDAADGEFDAVVAVGVLPWLHAPQTGVREMARVLRPGGVLVLTADSRSRLGLWLDPRLNPALARVRAWVKAAVGRGPRRDPALEEGGSRLTPPREVDRMLTGAGLERIGAETLGFGPFSFVGVPLPDGLGRPLDRLLQRAADRSTPGLRGTGWHYVVAARKPRPASSS